MRVHSHDVDDARELRPMGNRVKPDDTNLMYQAAAAGRTDVLGPTGLLSLQRATGNAAVQRLLGSSSTTPLAVQRYRVGARRTASCEQVIDWLNTHNPYRPEWAKTRARFRWTGGYVITGSAPDFQVTISHPRVTLRKRVDMPEWRPREPALAAAWSTMVTQLRAHEAEHEAIADRWRDALQDRLTNLSLTVSAASRSAAQRAARAAVQAEWNGWLSEHQDEQDSIDPFYVALECPGPVDRQAAP